VAVRQLFCSRSLQSYEECFCLLLCHHLEQGSNKKSGRCSLLTPIFPPEEGKRRKRERNLQIECKNSFTNNTNNINNKRNNAKYTKPTLSFPELGAGCWHPTSSCRAAPGTPRLASATDRNWTQEHMDLNLDQDRRQNNEQGPLHKPVMDKESETLVILQV